MRARPGEWDLPGGTLESVEEHEAGVLREVREETGLVLQNIELVSRRAGDWQGVGYEFSYYRAETTAVNVALSEEHDKYEWHEALVAATMIKYKPHLFGLGLASKQD